MPGGAPVGALAPVGEDAWVLRAVVVHDVRVAGDGAVVLVDEVAAAGEEAFVAAHGEVSVSACEWLLGSGGEAVVPWLTESCDWDWMGVQDLQC